MNMNLQCLSLLLLMLPLHGRIASVQGAVRQAAPLAPSAEPLRLNGGVPSGYMVLGESMTAPIGYKFSGLRLQFSTGQMPSWQSGNSLANGRADMACESINGVAYVFGGFDLTSHRSDVEAIDLLSGTVSAKSPMLTPRGGSAAAVVNDKIYVFGGSNGSHLPTAEEYDPSTDSWTAKAAMPTNRTWLAAASVGGKVYAIGGYNGSGSPGQYLDVVESYDPLLDAWVVRSPLPSALREMTAAVVNGKIFVFGISSSTYDFFEYDPDTNVWMAKGPWQGRSGVASAAMNGKIYLVGGWPSGVSALMDEYDPVNATWRSLPSMPTGRADLALGVHGPSGRLFAIGGAGVGEVFSAIEEYDTALRELYAHQKL